MGKKATTQATVKTELEKKTLTEQAKVALPTMPPAPEKDHAALAKLAAFVCDLDDQVPGIEQILRDMRAAAVGGVRLPVIFRTYAREDGQFGVVSGNASLTDREAFTKALARRTKYQVSLEGGAQFIVWDYRQKDDGGNWVNPVWKTHPKERRASAMRYYAGMMAATSELAGVSF